MNPKPPTVLLLDDDTNTLLALRAVLEGKGVRVFESEDERSALGRCAELREAIDLMVADVVLPASNGPAVVKRLKNLQPCMRLLYISGYSLGELDRRGLLRKDDLAPGNAEFLQKPFTPEAFLNNVQHLLNC